MTHYLIAVIGIVFGGFELFQGWNSWRVYKMGKAASGNVLVSYAFVYSFFIGAVLFILGISVLGGVFGN